MLVGHLSPGPHFSHQKVPEFSLCFQVGLKHLRPSGGADAKGGDPDEQKGSRGYFHRLHRKDGGVNGSGTLMKSSRRGLPADLYVPELCDFQEARLPLSEHEQAFLSHSYFTNAAGGLDAGRQLVNALVVVQTIYDLRGQAEVLGRSFRLLPKGVEQPEHSGIHLIGLGWDEERSQLKGDPEINTQTTQTPQNRTWLVMW